MTTLVTGGTGFIGAELVRMLVERGDDVVVAHRSGNFERIADVVERVTTVQADLGDDDAVAEMIRSVEPQRLFHFGATLTGPGEANPGALLRSNINGVVTLFEAAREAGTTQIIFASSIGTYGRDLVAGEPISDLSLQRPTTIYGVSKVFAENLGAWYRQRDMLDFRGLRYPSIVGPGVTTWSLAQYTSWMIEKSALGEPFEVWALPETVVPILYFRDAARAAVELSDAPIESITSINYLVDGVPPTPSAQQIADAVFARIPDAPLTFIDESAAEARLRRAMRLDDGAARNEWGWAPAFDLDAMVDDIISAVA